MKFNNSFLLINLVSVSIIKGVGRKISGGRSTEKARAKNSTIKPSSTLSVPCMKTQGGSRPPAPRSDVHEHYLLFVEKICTKSGCYAVPMQALSKTQK